MYKLNLVGSLLPANGPDELLRNNNFLITSGTSASFQFDLSSLAFGMVASQWGSPQPNLGPYKIVTNLLTHFEISGEQPSALADFYRNVFGWQIEQMPGVDYWRVRTGSSETKTLTGGLTYRAIPGLNGWMLFVNVASLDETVALV